MTLNKHDTKHVKHLYHIRAETRKWSTASFCLNQKHEGTSMKQEGDSHFSQLCANRVLREWLLENDHKINFSK